MIVRTPSVELAGKNANNRDLSIRFDIHDIPESDAAWIQAAVEQGLAVDEEKTIGNIIVGQHGGFAGLIKSYDSLNDVLRAREIVMPYLGTPVYKDALGSHLRAQRINIHDFQVENLHSSGPYASFHEAAEEMGLTIQNHSQSEYLNTHIDWEKMLLETKVANADYIKTSLGIWYFKHKEQT